MGDPEKQIALLYLLPVDKIIQMQVSWVGRSTRIHGDLEEVGKWTVMVLYKPEAVNHRQSLSLDIHLSQEKKLFWCLNSRHNRNQSSEFRPLNWCTFNLKMICWGSTPRNTWRGEGNFCHKMCRVCVQPNLTPTFPQQECNVMPFIELLHITCCYLLKIDMCCIGHFHPGVSILWRSEI